MFIECNQTLKVNADFFTTIKSVTHFEKTTHHHLLLAAGGRYHRSQVLH